MKRWLFIVWFLCAVFILMAQNEYRVSPTTSGDTLKHRKLTDEEFEAKISPGNIVFLKSSSSFVREVDGIFFYKTGKRYQEGIVYSRETNKFKKVQTNKIVFDERKFSWSLVLIFVVIFFSIALFFAKGEMTVMLMLLVVLLMSVLASSIAGCDFLWKGLSRFLWTFLLLMIYGFHASIILNFKNKKALFWLLNATTIFQIVLSCVMGVIWFV